METFTQIVFVLYLLFAGACGFAMVEKTPTGSRHVDLGISTFVYGGMTLAFLLLWDTPDLVSTIGRGVVLALMWLPWLASMFLLNKPRTAYTLGSALINAGSCAVQIAMILVFWV